MLMVKISVIIPVYNVEKYLKRCLDSVLSQTLREIEIICVNDGSTDNSIQILKEYGSKIKVINQENQGLSVARNIGLKEAKGEFVAFLDSDDFVDNNFYEELYSNAIKYNAEVACASILRVNEKKQKYILKYDNVMVSQNIQEAFNLADCPTSNFVWNKIYKKSLLDEYKISFVAGMIYEDMCFTPDVLEVVNRVISVPNTNYYYWKHKGTLIKGDSDKSRSDKLFGHQYLMTKCQKYNLKLSRQDVLMSKWDFFIWGFKIFRIKKYRATQKFYLFGILKILEIREGI